MKKLLKQNRVLIMGILNVTPDSFSDGGKFLSPQNAITQAKQMIADGANIIDIGGESSRPGSEPVSTLEEMNRVLPVIEHLREETKICLSIDTYKPEVAAKALQAGADIINDITGLRNPAMIDVAVKHQSPVVIMHMQGTPKNMQKNPKYDDVIEDIKQYLKIRVTAARQAGLKDIVIDPGIGFGKKLAHNLQILKRLHEFQELNCPILVGPSRKSFIENITGAPTEERLAGTIASVVTAVINGADIVRVHDVKECRQAIQVTEAITRSR